MWDDLDIFEEEIGADDWANVGGFEDE